MVTYTGNGTAGRTVSHNLGSVPGMIIVKSTSNAESWYVYHRGVDATAPEDYFLELEKTAARTNAAYAWNDTAPTSTEFTVGTVNDTNLNGATFVAYLFAHHDGDGDFGPDGDQDIIKCGSYTGNSNGESDDNGVEVNLGFEPQWILIKPYTWSSGDWQIFDAMRGIIARPTSTSRDGDDAVLFPNRGYAEDGASSFLRVTPTGFKLESDSFSVNSSSHSYIYVAIRRGPLAEPESATDVFKAVTRNSSTGGVNYYTGFPVDFSIFNVRTSPGHYVHARLTADKRLQTVNNNAEISGDAVDFQTNVGYQPGSSSTTTNALTWNWKRAPSFCDVVTYTGDGTGVRTINHNLGVAPEMIWIKGRNATFSWIVYHASLGNDYVIRLEQSSAASSGSSLYWNGTDPTDSVWTINSNLNTSGRKYICYLFATLAGISKVGSYTGNGSSQTIDCGFSAGARFILLKRTDSGGQWQVYDTERGIVSGDDPTLALNLTNAEVTTQDDVDPDNSGFIVNDDGNNTNTSGASYIFYAIA